MEEVSPAHSRTSKYASFSPKKEEDQTKVDTVEITYLDPVSQKLSNKDVFLDPDSWSRKHNELRFLISADLVNLVSESHAARQARFRKAKKRLEQARLAFLVDLWKLRGLVERMTRAAEEDGPETSAGVVSESCHVHFFVPELYFDDHTLECLKRASDVFLKHLLDEMELMQERLDLLGGKNWRNLLSYALKFMATTEIGSMLMDAIPNPKTRRMVENAITRGLWDQMDEIEPVVQELEEEMEDYNARFDSVQEDIARKLAQISSYNERHLQAVTRLEEKDPDVPADSDSDVPEVEEEEEEEEEDEDSEEDESATSSTLEWDEEEEIRKFIALQGQPPSKAQLKKLKTTQMRDAKIAKLKTEKAKKEQEIKGQSNAKIKELLQRWEKKVASAQEELKELEPSLQKAEDLEVEPVDEDLLEQSAQAKKMEEEAQKLTQQVEIQQQKVQVLQVQVQEEEVKVQQEEAEVQDLVQEVQSLPPPDPRWRQLRTLGEEQVELMKKSKILEEKIIKITGRVRLLKMELRELYKILGLTWEESSSDDGEDEDDKPYWLRKKLAQKTASERTPFNNHHFLDDEKNALQKRLKKRIKEQKLKAAALLLGRLAAARRTQDHSGNDAPKESNVLPFRQDMAFCPVPEGEVIKEDVSRSLQLLKDTLETTLFQHVQKDSKAGDNSDGDLRKIIPLKKQEVKGGGLSRQSAESELRLSSSRMSSHSIVPMGENSPQSQDGGQRDVVARERLDLKRPRDRGQAASRGGGSVDFGFRPDGAGEESVESWSLFKVNKGQSDVSVEKSPALRTSLSTERVLQRPRLDTAASCCDFGEYVSQLQQSRGVLHSKSANDLSKKGRPCLPDLVNTSSQQKLTQLDWSRGPLRRWKSDRRRLNVADRPP